MTASHERIVLTYGTFDLFHPGHVQLLKRARELGSRLVVGLSTDEFNAKKGKKIGDVFRGSPDGFVVLSVR